MSLTNFNLEKLTEIDLYDTIFYLVTINVINTCKESLLNGGSEWVIRARSLDGCYEETFITTNGKTALLEVPPKEVVFTVSDANNQDLINY